MLKAIDLSTNYNGSVAHEGAAVRTGIWIIVFN